ncbi:MAG: DUF3261 domain-containing protein [Myxococcales bacterium]|nr:DUF3261 domain-containing protein [Myxococcales bacterium]
MIERDFMSTRAPADDRLVGHRGGKLLRVLLLLVVVSVSATTLFACGHPPARHPVAPDPQVLVDVSEIPGDFLVHQEVRAKFGSDNLVFQAVIQKQGTVLTIVTLAPDGSRAYLIEQSGKVVNSEKYVSRELPFSPIHILQDVHRCYFMAGDSLPSSSQGTGTTRTLRLAEYIDEDYRDQLLVRRVFRTVAAQTGSSSDAQDKQAGAVVATVEYTGPGENLLERPVVYRNQDLNYVLDIRPIAYSVLSPDGGDSTTPEAGASVTPEGGASAAPEVSPAVGESITP